MVWWSFPQVAKSKRYLSKLYYKTDAQRFGGGVGLGDDNDDLIPIMPPEPSPPALSSMHYQP